MHCGLRLHRYAVRRVLFSPHAESLLASCSYDMSVKLWDYRAPADTLLRSWGHHSEFAVGLDFSLMQEGMMASAGWDEWVCVWHQSGVP
jgi:peroxin-7